MTIASFHQQVNIEQPHPLLVSLSVLRLPSALRGQLESPTDQGFRYWFIWPV